MIDLDQNPLKLRILSKGTYFICSLADQSFKLIDPLNDNNVLKVKTTHDEISEIQVS